MTRTRDVALVALAVVCFAGAVAAGGADLGAGAAHRGVPLGVDPKNAARFQGETFVCDGGAVSLDFSRVNDDYCDCADGADEPGTSACSSGSFHCRNRGHQPVNVPSSRVGDGICDCCDGSDERAAGGAACANTCAGAGASRRDELRREVSEHRAGLRKKAALVDAAPAERKRWMEKRDKLTRDAAAASAKAEAARAAADAASAEHERAKEEAKAFEAPPETLEDVPEDVPAETAVAEDRLPEDVAADGDVENPADPADPAFGDETDEERGERIARQWIKTDRESGEGSGSAESASASTTKTSGLTLVDVDDDPDRDGSVDYGGFDDSSGFASPAGPTALEPEDAPEDARDGKKKSSSSFSLRSWFGGGKKRSGSDLIADGKSRVVDTPEARKARARLAKASAAASSAAEAATSAEARLDETRKSLDDVAADLKRFVGARAEFQHMLGQCYTAQVDKYEYIVCPFAESKQDGTRLGRMRPLEPSENDDDSIDQFRFEEGETCWNGPSRSMTVSLACGASPRLFAVTEPSRCEYAAVLATPAVCDETVAAALEAELAEMEREIATLARGEELR